jgi:hypothetical protein
MSNKEFEEELIRSYQRDESMMILVYSQWCINNDIDPEMLYKRAYPDQADNVILKQTLALTVPKEEAGEIGDETMLGVLSLFGNEELAFVVTQEIAKRPRP